MTKATLRRLLAFPLILILVNFSGFAYALIANAVLQSQNPWGSNVDGFPPIFLLYGDYLAGITQGNFGTMPTPGNKPILAAMMDASGASLGLLAIAFLISLPLGLFFGFRAVKNEPARVSWWLTPVSSFGLALPSFYVGALLILAILYQMIAGGPDAKPILPLTGFGWDLHLVLPVLALLVRPTVQVAQVFAEFMAGELDKQYVVASRAMGHTWGRIRWKHALRNVLAPLTAAVTGSFRGLVGDLILIEWLFGWPGLGQYLVHALVPPSGAAPGGLVGETNIFLSPPIVASILTAYALLFLTVDLVSTTITQVVDPRLRTEHLEEVENA